jgi:spore maturation protein CgeB
MLILYCGMKYDYGRAAQGHSFEHHNFYNALVNMGHDVLYFDFMTLLQEHGKSWMNRRLIEVALSEKPALMFTILFTDEIDKKSVRAISDSGEITTMNWFCDDHWRFENYSRHWAPHFNWVVTTEHEATQKYAEMGYRTCIKSQWACNHFLYRKLDLPLAYDVTFIGQPHGTRRAVIEFIRQAGIDVRVWGNGWESGRISQEEMIRVFNQSRINLNLSNASVSSNDLLSRTRRSVASKVGRVLKGVPGGSLARGVGKRLLSAGKRKVGNLNASTGETSVTDQIKGRNFEVPGCGGFLLTGKADNLEQYYEPGRELLCFENPKDLIDKIRFFLGREEERAAIAEAGYERTMREHTYVQRFAAIFERAGLGSVPTEKILSGKITHGQTLEVG